MSVPTVEGAPPGVAPAPSPRRPLGGLTFRHPAEDELSTTIQTEDGPEWTGEGSPSDQLDDSPSVSAWPTDESDADDESAPTSSRGSSADAVRPLGKAMQTAAARQAVLVASGMAHRFATTSEAQLMVGLYLADEEDAERIGDPLARIAGRRVKDSAAIANPDAADAISAMLGLAGYVSKQIVKLSEARTIAPEAAPGPVDV